jgi:hypothetical protein
MGLAEELFEGKPTGLPVPMARSRALYREESDPVPVVKHVAGYDQFVEFCVGRGVQAQELAADAGRLFWYLRTIGSEIANDSALKAAAAVFAGNTLARLRPDAEWTTYEGAAPTVGNAEMHFEVDRLLDALRSADVTAVQGLVAVVTDWVQEEPDDSPAMYPRPVAQPAGLPPYVRPALPEATYYFDDGAPIPYGRRWGDGGPDSESYSVESHLERFAGLHLVASALIAHLAATYDVEVHEDQAHAAEPLMEARDVLEAVKVTPRSAGAAPLTFVLTGYPGVVVHAGVLHDFTFPVCGCDACDETVRTTADRLEMLVLSVAAGGFAERYPVGRRRWSEYALTAFDGSGSESGKSEPVAAADRLREAEIRLRGVPGGWNPWPLRQS